MNLEALRRELVAVATKVITRALEVQGRIEAGIGQLEEYANRGKK